VHTIPRMTETYKKREEDADEDVGLLCLGGVNSFCAIFCGIFFLFQSFRMYIFFFLSVGMDTI